MHKSNSTRPRTQTRTFAAKCARVLRGLALAFALLLQTNALQAQRILFVAGNGTQGTAGDNGPATQAQLSNPVGLTVDRQGNLYISDQDRVRKVDAMTGYISTYAGGGNAVVGDGGPATAAKLSLPRGLAVDVAGNLYIADESNNRIRKVEARTGNISTYVGGGSAALADGIKATALGAFVPASMAIDGRGNIFFRDKNTTTIWRVDAVTRKVRKIAGGGAIQKSGITPSDRIKATDVDLIEPRSISVDASGNLYCAVPQYSEIFKVNGADGIISSVSINPQISSSEYIALDEVNNHLYVIGANTPNLRKIDLANGTWSVVAGGGSAPLQDNIKATSAILSPAHLAIDAQGSLYTINSTFNRTDYRVLKISKSRASLFDGNQRFMSGKLRHPNQTRQRLADLSIHQEPFAVVLSCSDSRVPPEVAFDCGLGDLFDVRTAGHVLDDAAIASIEYATDPANHLETPLVVVLGHSKCGAVTETIEAIKHPPKQGLGLLQPLVDYIKSAYTPPPSTDELYNTIRINTAMTVQKLQAQSKILKDLVDKGALEIVGAYYDLNSGEVEFLP